MKEAEYKIYAEKPCKLKTKLLTMSADEGWKAHLKKQKNQKEKEIWSITIFSQNPLGSPSPNQHKPTPPNLQNQQCEFSVMNPKGGIYDSFSTLLIKNDHCTLYIYIEREREKNVIYNFPCFCNNFVVVSTKTRPLPKKFTHVFPHTCGVPTSSSQSKLKMKNKKIIDYNNLLLLVNYA